MELHFVPVMGTHFCIFHFFVNEPLFIFPLIYGGNLYLGLERCKLYRYIRHRWELGSLELIPRSLDRCPNFLPPQNILSFFIQLRNIDVFESIILYLRDIDISKFSLLRRPSNRAILRGFW